MEQKLFDTNVQWIKYKVLKEVAFKGIVTVAKNRLAFEVLAVVPHLVFNIA